MPAVWAGAENETLQILASYHQHLTDTTNISSFDFMKPKRSLLTTLFALILSAASADAQTTIVDIIPKAQQNERAQNSEPNIAVDPADPTKIVISAFGNGGNPIFISKNGGTSWSLLQKVPAGDISIGWGGPYNTYMTTLTRSGSAIGTLRLHDPTIKSAFRGVAHSVYRPGGDGPDQPWTEATFVEGVDRIYIAFNDLSQKTKTASIRQSRDSGRTWQNTVIERIEPGDGSDGAAVRVAASGDTVYAAFQRYSQVDANEDETGDIIVVRDDAAGAHNFMDLGLSGVGKAVATGETLPQGSIGQERLGSDLSIAVDPNNPARVAVAYATIQSGDIVVVIHISTNSGASWNKIFTTPADSALPALAIAANGTIGLLYTSYDGTKLETHLTQSSNNFTTNTDLLLSKFEDQSLVSDFDPYIGDYEDLVAVGNTFYGTFSASNDTTDFPQQPVFLRDRTLLGTKKVPFSIDPFFFKTPALP
jgi:hypothetical protein